MSTAADTIRITRPTPARRRRPARVAVGVVAAVLVVAVVLVLSLTAQARAAARTAEAEEDAAALLAAHGTATAADQDLAELVGAAQGQDADVLTGALEAMAHARLAGVDATGLESATTGLRTLVEDLADRGPVPALDAPTTLADDVDPAEGEAWTAALAAAYRALPDDERAAVRAGVAETVADLERRASGAEADRSSLGTSLDDARAALDDLVAAAGAHAAELASAAALAPEELRGAVVAAGETLSAGPSGADAVASLRTLADAAEAAGAAHTAAEQAAAEEAARAEAARAAAAQRRSGSGGSGGSGSWTDVLEYDPCLATLCSPAWMF